MILEVETLMVSHYKVKFGCHRHSGSVDIFLIAEKENPRCSHCLFLKDMV